MKLFNKIRLGILMFALFASAGCSKWLDVKLENEVDEEKLFSKEQGFKDALLGIYSQMSKGSMYGQTLSYEMLDIIAQSYDYTNLKGSYEKMRDLSYLDKSVRPRIDAVWYQMYNNIAAANNIIGWVAKNGHVMSDRVRSQVHGEALALRAFLHFDLLRMFAPDVKLNPKDTGIPYNKEFGVSRPPMYSVEETLQLVINDLKDALVLLNEDPIRSTAPYELGNEEGQTKNGADEYVARFNYYAVQAELARAYLMKGDQKMARDYADSVINSGKFALVDYKKSIDVPEEKLDVLFSDEHIFSLRNKDIPEKAQELLARQVTESSSSDAKLKMPSYLSTIYGGNNDDTRYGKWFNVGGSYMEKYNKKNTKKFFPKIPVIKLSEMYFIAAEGWMGVDDQKALGYLNSVRSSRIRNTGAWTYISMEYLLEEMRRDFQGEGQLFFIYKRLNREIRRESAEGNIYPSNSIFVFPMPKSEIEQGNRN